MTPMEHQLLGFQIVASSMLGPDEILMVPARRPFESNEDLAKRSVKIIGILALTPTKTTGEGG